VTVSVLDAGAARRFRCQTDNQGLFPGVCAKAGNGFITRENCFVARAGRNNSLRSSMTSVTYGAWNRVWRDPSKPSIGP
jgi:hypothetical protein